MDSLLCPWMDSPGAKLGLFMAYAWRDYVLIFYFFFVWLYGLVWHHVKAGLRPCVSYFMSINYATTCLENSDGHSLKYGGVFDGVYCVKMMQVDWLHEHDLCIL